jgi:hypothetical protein
MGGWHVVHGGAPRGGAALPPTAARAVSRRGATRRHTLEELGKQPGTLALIFGKAQNEFDSHRLMAMLTLRAPCGRPISDGDCQDPAKLRRVMVDLIDNDVAVRANVSVANVKARSGGRNHAEA